jgi:hypothetical protein
MTGNQTSSFETKKRYEKHAITATYILFLGSMTFNIQKGLKIGLTCQEKACICFHTLDEVLHSIKRINEG